MGQVAGVVLIGAKSLEIEDCLSSAIAYFRRVGVFLSVPAFERYLAI